MDIGIGEDVFSVGRFVNREGRQKNTPALRFGNISQMPGEPIRCDGFTQNEAFLVEMRSVAGYSGSPVFVDVVKYVPYPPGIPKEKFYKYGGLRLVGGNLLLGINFCHILGTEPETAVNGNSVPQERRVQINSGMAGVIPAWRLVDILERTKLKEHIENLKAKLTAQMARKDESEPALGSLSNDETA